VNNAYIIFFFSVMFGSLLILTGVITAKLNGNLDEKIVYVLPEKTNMPCMIYKVDGAFVIIINDEELSK
jgi:hypothetical protein